MMNHEVMYCIPMTHSPAALRLARTSGFEIYAVGKSHAGRISLNEMIDLNQQFSGIWFPDVCCRGRQNSEPGGAEENAMQRK